MLRPTRYTLSRLAARQTRAAEHPDTNLLQAFREQSLTAKERSALMSHLSICLECREVLSLLAPSLERERASTPPAPRSFGLAWSKRRWAAAALAAVCLLLVFRSWRNPASPARHTVALPPASPEVPPASKPAPPLNETRETNQTLKLLPKQQARLRIPAPKIPAPPELSIKTPSAPADKELDLYSRASEIQPKKTGDSDLRTFKMPNHYANAEAQEMGLRDLPTPNGNKLDDSQATKVGKLMPPAGGLYSFAPAPRSVLRSSLKAKAFTAQPIAARWSLTAPGDTVKENPGVLYRSQDEGQTWTAVQVSPGTPLTALATAAPDIWAGSAGGTLYHSADNGYHWVACTVADEQERLTAPIARIDTPEAGHIVLKVHSGRDWMSVDYGQHWALR